MSPVGAKGSRHAERNAGTCLLQGRRRCRERSPVRCLHTLMRGKPGRVGRRPRFGRGYAPLCVRSPVWSAAAVAIRCAVPIRSALSCPKTTNSNRWGCIRAKPERSKSLPSGIDMRFSCAPDISRAFPTSAALDCAPSPRAFIRRRTKRLSFPVWSLIKIANSQRRTGIWRSSATLTLREHHARCKYSPLKGCTCIRWGRKHMPFATAPAISFTATSISMAFIIVSHPIVSSESMQIPSCDFSTPI